MAQIFLMKNDRGCLMAADEESRAFVRKMHRGQVVACTTRLPRNAAYHRRAFALFQFAYSCWTPPDVPGAIRSFDSFRRQLVVAAGFHRTVLQLDGTTVLEPESLAWDSMSQDRFEACVEAITEVLANGFLPGIDAETLEDWSRQYEAAA